MKKFSENTGSEMISSLIHSYNWLSVSVIFLSTKDINSLFAAFQSWEFSCSFIVNWKSGLVEQGK